MTDQNKIVASETAVLCMDYQHDIASIIAEKQPEIFKQATETLQIARGMKMKVIYISVQFRPGYPEVGVHNKLFAALSQSGRLVMGTPGAQIHEAVHPQEGDILISKKRVSAFAGSDLEVVLRANGIRTLVLFGISTSGVVLSTLRQAADMDFNCYVLRDLCADLDPEVHICLLDKIFPRQADVISSAEFKQRAAL